MTALGIYSKRLGFRCSSIPLIGDLETFFLRKTLKYNEYSCGFSSQNVSISPVPLRYNTENLIVLSILRSRLLSGLKIGLKHDKCLTRDTDL